MNERWIPIASFYRDLITSHGWKLQSMLTLVENIAASRYASGLVGRTSHAALLICRTEESFDSQVDVLRIEAKDDRVSFEFREAGYRPVAWARTCPAAESFGVLEHFVRDLKRWFVD